MAIFTATTYTYSQALDLIYRLKSEDIEANISVGGVMVRPKPQDVLKAREICKETGASLDPGYADDDISDVAEKIHGDARSVLREWEE